MSGETTNNSASNNRLQTGGASKTVQDRVDAVTDKVGDALDRGRSGIAGSAQSAGDSLSADIAKLRDDIHAIQQTLAKFASDAGGEALDTAQSIGSAVRGAASDMASAAKEQTKTLTSEVESAARRHPLGTIGAALLAGVIIGMVSRRRRA
jgi:ElaB/YqjD/DUF883 family membrane-anchored ribosome-binding protein